MKIERADIERYIFRGDEAGPYLWVSASVHGNELAGSKAIDRVRREIESNSITLKRGLLYLVPRLNHVGIEAGLRFVDSDVNRRVVPVSGGDIDTYEDLRRQKIVRALDRFCARPPLVAHYLSGGTGGFPGGAWIHRPPPDYDRFVLDLHSFHTPGKPHAWVYADKPAFVLWPKTNPFVREKRFAQATGVDLILNGWKSAYARSDNDEELGYTGIKAEIKPGTWAHEVHELGFRKYAHRLAIREELKRVATTIGQRAHDRGATSITVECGQHDDPAAVEFAYRSIRGALAHAGLTEGGNAQSVSPVRHEFITVERVVFRIDTDRLARPFRDLEEVRPEEPVILSEKRRSITAPDYGINRKTLILFPNRDAKIGSEIVYFASARKSPQRTVRNSDPSPVSL